MFVRDGEIKNQRAYEAMMRGMERQAGKANGYPADVQIIIEKVCELWNLEPPTTKKSKAYWIQSARELKDACGEFGWACIEQVRLEEQRGMEPYFVEGPNSLVKRARRMAGTLRAKSKPYLPVEMDEEPPTVDTAKAEREQKRRELIEARIAQLTNGKTAEEAALIRQRMEAQLD
jgi:hypothetical protein